MLAMEIYAGFRPQPAQAFLARLRRWIDTHTDLWGSELGHRS